MNSKLFNKGNKTYRVSSPFGHRDLTVDNKDISGYHIGVDYAYPQGTQLVSPLDVEILDVRTYGDYGGQIFAYAKDINKTIHYAHVSKIDVKKGQTIKKGTVLGLSGGAKGTHGAGLSTGAHLHLGLASGRVTDVIKGKYGDGKWNDPNKANFNPKPNFNKVAEEVRNGDYGNEPHRTPNLKKKYPSLTDKDIKEIQGIVDEYYKKPKPQPEKPKPQKPKPQPAKNDYGQDVQVGDTIYFSYLYTAVSGGITYNASATGKAQKISEDYIETITVNGRKVRAFKAKVGKIYPKKSGVDNPYELVTHNGKSIFGRTRPVNTYRKA